MSTYTNDQELNEGLYLIETEQRLEMVQAAEAVASSLCTDSEESAS